MASNRVECHYDVTVETVWWEPSSSVWLLFLFFMQFEDLAQFPDHPFPSPGLEMALFHTLLQEVSRFLCESDGAKDIYEH